MAVKLLSAETVRRLIETRVPGAWGDIALSDLEKLSDETPPPPDVAALTQALEFVLKNSGDPVMESVARAALAASQGE